MRLRCSLWYSIVPTHICSFFHTLLHTLIHFLTLIDFLPVSWPVNCYAGSVFTLLHCDTSVHHTQLDMYCITHKQKTNHTISCTDTPHTCTTNSLIVAPGDILPMKAKVWVLKLQGSLHVEYCYKIKVSAQNLNVQTVTMCERLFVRSYCRGNDLGDEITNTQLWEEGNYFQPMRNKGQTRKCHNEYYNCESVREGEKDVYMLQYFVCYLLVLHPEILSHFCLNLNLHINV